MTEMTNKRTERSDLILDAALKVFGRQGFKKTSIDDITLAAGISKQGLYLYFASKQEILVAALTKYLDDGLNLVQDALASEALPLGERLYAAMDVWFGRHFENFKPEAFDIIEAGNRISPKQAEEYKEAFLKKITKAISSSSEFRQSPQITSAREIAQVLFICGLTWKEPHESRKSFMATIALSISVCCQVKIPRRLL